MSIPFRIQLLIVNSIFPIEFTVILISLDCCIKKLADRSSFRIIFGFIFLPIFVSGLLGFFISQLFEPTFSFDYIFIIFAILPMVNCFCSFSCM